MSQMFAQAKLARRPARVKPERALAARNPSGRVENKQTQVVRRGNLKRSVLNDSNRPVRTRMPGGVGGVGQVTARVKVVVASVMQPTVEYSRQANASL
jgi:hypothetical protein